MIEIRQRWGTIQENLQKQSKGHVTVVAISKKQSWEKIKTVYDLGLRHFGENYVQEALPKIQQSTQLSIQWHYVGTLQTNKMNKLVPAVHYLHAIDAFSQIEKLQKLKELGVTIPKLFVQINVANETTKSGLEENRIQTFMEHISQHTHLEISGLMTFPPLQRDPEKNRPYFAKMMEWKERIHTWKLDRIEIVELSMGVSSDYEVALQEGATMIRLGEALFGPRIP
jgi:pyridoxal phosphate enzyme (YggS family)